MARSSRTYNQFSFQVYPKETATFEEVSITPIRKTGYILNIDGARNREEIFEH